MADFELTDKEWRDRLAPDQYAVLRRAATEPPWSGALLKNKDTGVYECAACGNPLFSSDTKFDSGTGWPSFWEPIGPNAVTEIADTTHGMRRVEIRCARCDSHLGHVFPDGPRPTGQRYCMNSLALAFDPATAGAGAAPGAEEGSGAKS
jgi:peptide-methionine (R)-S-oxide reductase